MSDCISERQDGVLLIRFNRPAAMNAMGGTLMQEFDQALDEARWDDRVRAVVVTGEGRGWCAGADLQAMASGGSGEERHDVRAQALDPVGGAGRTIRRLNELDIPVVAAVNGAAVGAGFGLCTACDIRIASDQARFSTIFIKRAIGPDFGLSWHLPRLIGPEKAADLFYTGRMIGAAEALELGLVLKVVPADSLLPEAMDYAGVLAKQPPSALTYTRRALRASATNSLAQQLELEWGNQKVALGSPEFMEAARAFIEKREPDFSKT
ncbi:MAG: enoyl-CoA hydratase/isomerase family protein [Dehalococcoidia bacterium]